MPRINERYREFRIPDLTEREYQQRLRTHEQFRGNWDRLNRSNFQDTQARKTLVDLVDPQSSPAAANSIITTLRFINTLAQRDISINPVAYLANADCEVVKEMVLHHLANFAGVPYILANQFTYSSSEKVRDAYLAVNEGRYRSNPEWMVTVEHFTQSLLIDIAARILSQYSAATPDNQVLQESALVAVAMIHNQQVYEKIGKMASLASPELARRLAADRLSYKDREYAYHSTTEERLLSIAEKGLSALYAPQGCEQPEMICFNNTFYAGVEFGRLGFAGYYSREYLLRVPFEPPLMRAMRMETEELCDATADYALYKPAVIPPEKIELVDPNIATRAIPLIKT